MALYTDIVTPAELTGYARAALADYETRSGTERNGMPRIGSLARFLPNRTVPSITARFVKGDSGLIDVAEFRAYDAELDIGGKPTKQRVTLELPALGKTIPVTEYEQLRAQAADVSDAEALLSIENTATLAARSAADAMERMRGIVLSTGKATIDQSNFKADDNFGRAAGHTDTAPALWSVSGTDAIGQLEDFSDTYVEANGEEPGALVMSTTVFRNLIALDQFSVTVAGASRRATASEVRDHFESAGLPPIYLYDRRVKVGGSMTRVMPADEVWLLPMPVDVDAWEDTDLGASFWGRTLTSQAADWQIAAEDQPGIVTGVYRNEKPPMGLEVIADAIGLPVLANANLSMAITVL